MDSRIKQHIDFFFQMHPIRSQEAAPVDRPINVNVLLVWQRSGGIFTGRYVPFDPTSPPKRGTQTFSSAFFRVQRTSEQLSRKVLTQNVTFQKSGREQKNTEILTDRPPSSAVSRWKLELKLKILFSPEGSFDSLRTFLVYLKIKKEEQIEFRWLHVAKRKNSSQSSPGFPGYYSNHSVVNKVRKRSVDFSTIISLRCACAPEQGLQDQSPYSLGAPQKVPGPRRHEG